MAEQKVELEKLIEDTKQVAMAAELPEPRLSKRLEDALRAAKADTLPDQLTQAADMLDGSERTFPDTIGAEQLNQQTSAEIAKLTQGIEDAARNILGDETEALRVAQREV